MENSSIRAIVPDRKQALLQGLIGGVLSGIGIFTYGVWLMPIGLAFLWAASRFNFAGALWGLVAVLVSHSWLLALHPLMWIGVPELLSLPIALGIWIFCGLFGGFLVWIWCSLGKGFSVVFTKEIDLRRNLFFIFLMAAIWGLGEVGLARLPFFWIGVGGSVAPSDRILAGIARWTGAGGLAMVQLLLGWWLWCILTLIRNRIQFVRSFIIGIGCLFLLHLIGWNLLLKSSTPLSTSSIAIWQPSIPTRSKFSEKEINQLPYRVKSALQIASSIGADFLVAPEGTLLIGQELLNPSPLPFLSGGFRWERGRQRSALLFFDQSEKNPSKVIDKNRLVPLGEWTPDLFGFSFPGLSAVGGLEPGEPSRLFTWTGPSLAAAICYELSDGFALANGVSDGAQWILAIANLDPYPLVLQRQFLALAQLRSIETARNVLIAGNTGPSSLVTSSGKVNALIEPLEDKVKAVEVSFYGGKTGYLLWREAPIIFIIITSLIKLIVSKKYI